MERLRIERKSKNLPDLIVDMFDDGSGQVNFVGEKIFEAMSLSPEDIRLLREHLSIVPTAPYRNHVIKIP